MDKGQLKDKELCNDIYELYYISKYTVYSIMPMNMYYSVTGTLYEQKVLGHMTITPTRTLHSKYTDIYSIWLWFLPLQL